MHTIHIPHTHRQTTYPYSCTPHSHAYYRLSHMHTTHIPHTPPAPAHTPHRYLHVQGQAPDCTQLLALAMDPQLSFMSALNAFWDGYGVLC